MVGWYTLLHYLLALLTSLYSPVTDWYYFNFIWS
jgi:hypothetical protein